MHYPTSITGAAVLLALAPSALALGTATLVNSCGFDVYYASVATTSEAMTLLPPGGSYSEAYTEQGVGVSIKVGPTNSITGPITQFEFTWAAGMVSYDISNINGNPFATEGMVLTPSTPSSSKYPTCLPVDCPAGPAGSTCAAAYNQPNNVATMVCDQSASLTFDVCSGAKSKFKRESEGHPDVAITNTYQRVHARHMPKK